MKTFWRLTLPLLLLLTAMAAAGPTGYRTGVIQDSRKSGHGKPAYTIKVSYPIWPSDKSSKANLAAEKIARDDVALFKKDYREVVDDHGIASDLQEGFTVVYSNADLISVLFEGSSFLAGAHPGPIYHSLLIRRRQNAPCTLSQCFLPKTPWLKAMAATCVQQLQKDPEADRDWIGRGAGPQLVNYALTLPTAKGLRVIFPPYQVASYAEGPKEVLVPYAVVQRFIDPQGPLRAFR